jgi:rhamnogalacturonyl hydrolase YesR
LKKLLTVTQDEIKNSIEILDNYIRSNDFSGYDPYDALNSKKLNKINSEFIKILLTQFFVYSPINFRNFFNILKEKNPKAIGLIISSYCKLFKCGLLTRKDFDAVISKLFDYLLKTNSKGYSGHCWGFNFNWQDISRFGPKWLPTIVVTSYVGNSILDLYESTKNIKFKKIAKDICHFLINDLNITKTEKGICFSYTPIDNHLVHNANCLGAAYLSRVYSITKEKKILDYSKKAINFSIFFQKENGSWSYRLNLRTKKERNQIDFHQGFILDSLIDFCEYTSEDNEILKNSIINGSEFYMKKQFNNLGCSKWRLPWNYPIDIHHQAQGIITFSKLYTFFNDEKYLRFAEKIAKWTIDYMQNEKGFFYYQKWPFFVNKISYMRWGQSWMMLALSTLIKVKMGDYYEANN